MLGKISIEETMVQRTFWLRESKNEIREKWPDFELKHDENIIYAEEKNIIVSSLNKENDEFYNDISSYKRMIRVTGWIYRFYENTKTYNKKIELSEEEL
ncbi:integrase catalytic domain-containing protein [Nephila pilipes]|uniref:Integrase catalytic domain-containing protein n=1 Tax=Nephila pilipes TaxID=299642 RepID=A0A8X6QUL1_NEPPI|nr:integrase catalytic domain-containing protein [Nephila pilipes]